MRTLILVVLFAFVSTNAALSRPDNTVPSGESTTELYNKGKALHLQERYAEAVVYLRRAAELGSTAAQSDLGSCYYYGEGVPKSYPEALKWFRKAAEQGHAHAQYSIGWQYYYGQGVTQNYSEAIAWYGKAAAQGDADDLIEGAFKK